MNEAKAAMYAIRTMQADRTKQGRIRLNFTMFVSTLYFYACCVATQSVQGHDVMRIPYEAAPVTSSATSDDTSAWRQRSSVSQSNGNAVGRETADATSANNASVRFKMHYMESQEMSSGDGAAREKLSRREIRQRENFSSANELSPNVMTPPAQNDSQKDLWILGLFPLNGSWAGGLGQLPAVQMGIEDVNNDVSMLPGYQLRMTVDDTKVQYMQVLLFHTTLVPCVVRRHTAISHT